MLGPRIRKRPSEWHPDPAELREAIEQGTIRGLFPPVVVEISLVNIMETYPKIYLYIIIPEVQKVNSFL